MKNLWMPDAAQFASQAEFEKVIYRNFDIDRFLEKAGEGDNLYFLIGPKGSGKTHLLQSKSLMYHHADTGFRFNVDAKQLVEYIKLARNTLSHTDLQKFRDAELWINIWTLCLMVVALKSADITLPAPLERKVEALLGDNSRIDSMLLNIINNRDKMREIVNLAGELASRIGDIKNGVAIFIDNVDQEFEDIIMEARNGSSDTYDQETLKAAVETWVNSQMGMVDAIYALCTRNNHLKIFATIRLEAFRIDRPRGQNYEYHGIKLHYGKEEIQRILNNRIKVISGKSDISQFLGFDKIPHSYYKNPDGTPYEEDIFNFIYRHTYGRPREITAIGQKLNNLIADRDYPKWDLVVKQDKVRHLVNEEAKRFFERYKQEVIPFFDNQEFQVFMETLDHNVFSAEETHRFKPETLNFYYTLGLIGYAANPAKGMIQKFRDFSQYEFQQIRKLPPAEYYFIHPTLNRTLMEVKNHDVLDKNHLIGPDLPFHPVPTESEHILIQRYKPAKVVGETRWANAGYRHRDTLQAYYDLYFTRRPEVRKQLLINLEAEFNKNLTAVIRFCLSQALFDKFGKGYALELEDSKRELRRAFPKKNIYLKELPLVRENIDDARSLFGHRLYGRLITLGCCLFANMYCPEIHLLLTKDEAPELGLPMSKEAFRFLQGAFFIRGLSSNPISLANNRQEIFSHLSLHEQELLRKWRVTLQQWVGKVAFVVPTHKNWALEHWLAGIWSP